MSSIKRYSFKRNGWDLRMVMTIPYDKPVNNEIAIKWRIQGYPEFDGTYNLKTEKITANAPLEIPAYEDTGKSIFVSSFKVEKDTAIRIRMMFID